jgi:hypothetical protein
MVTRLGSAPRSGSEVWITCVVSGRRPVRKLAREGEQLAACACALRNVTPRFCMAAMAGITDRESLYQPGRMGFRSSTMRNRMFSGLFLAEQSAGS